MSNRRPIIAGNWKMNKIGSEALLAADQIKRILSKGSNQVDIIIAPPFTALSLVASTLNNSTMKLSAQNLFWEDDGAFTGEISAKMLIAAGCSYVIVGHSERRHYFRETDTNINKKIRAAIAAGLSPLMCIGETESQRNANQTFEILEAQVQRSLEGFSAEELANLVIAYEPVWAIGTGKTASSYDAQDVHRFVRTLLAENFGETLADNLRIIYGGSVKPDNIEDLMAMPDIDGVLVGGASLNPESFCKLANW